MLDEANVGRFVSALQELSKKTQFIVITHNRADPSRMASNPGLGRRRLVSSVTAFR